MRKQAGSNPWTGRIIGVVAAVVTVVLAVRLVYGFLGPKPDPYELAWYVCEADGTCFAAPREVPPVACPTCKAKTGVLVSWLRWREAQRGG